MLFDEAWYKEASFRSIIQKYYSVPLAMVLTLNSKRSKQLHLPLFQDLICFFKTLIVYVLYCKIVKFYFQDKNKFPTVSALKDEEAYIPKVAWNNIR